MGDFVCPKCYQRLLESTDILSCAQCRSCYEIKEDIPVFIEKSEYWCNVSREKMLDLIQDAEKSRDWLSTAYRHIPKCIPAFVPLYRADAQFLFPIDKNARVLDAGSMWGGLTVPIAQFCKEIYAVDKTWETLRFLQVRAKQMKLKNIVPVVASTHHLPFPDDYFDFAVLNGVLEWLGVAQDVVLDEHWCGKQTVQYDYTYQPEEMQRQGLQELYRVLKPGGGIYIAIENRIGLQYFCGHPDDHVNVRFIPFLPRWMANGITKKIRNTDYRTYIYSPKKLVDLIESAGFQNTKLYSAYPHYGKMSRLSPFSIFNHIKKIATTGYAHIKVFVLSLVWKLIPNPICQYLSPSLAVIASKGEGYNFQPRLLEILSKNGLIEKDDILNYELILANNRFGNGHSVNYLVYDKRAMKMQYFCKISRAQQNTSLLLEAENLARLLKQLQQTSISNSIPKLYYGGVEDGITIQVVGYLDAKNIHTGILNGLRRMNKFLSFDNRLLGFCADGVQRLSRRYWLLSMDSVILKAIDWLVVFQEATKGREFNIHQEGTAWLREKIGLLKNNQLMLDDAWPAINTFGQALNDLENITLPLCAQHGDFDICNLLRSAAGLYVVDFEHAEENQLPFFDLGNLIFSPLIAEWRLSCKKISLPQYVINTSWESYLKKWIHYYFQKSHLDERLIRFFPLFVVLEQNAKQYPAYRDPKDYPLFGQDSFNNMIGWCL